MHQAEIFNNRGMHIVSSEVATQVLSGAWGLSQETSKLCYT